MDSLTKREQPDRLRINMRESFEVEYRTMRPAGGAMARRAARLREFPQSLQSISRRKAGSDLPDD